MKSEKFLRKTVKVAGGLCAAAGVIAVTSVIASKETVNSICEGLKTANRCMKRIIEDVVDEVQSTKEEVNKNE